MITEEDFREVLSHFATGVTVVTVTTGEQRHGMTVNAFSAVSLTPPLVQFCADVETLTHDLVAEAAHYGVNILTRKQDELSLRFAGPHHEMDDPFEGIALTTAETGAPLFEDALASLDCSLEASHEAGDHTIYVGRIEEGIVRKPDAPPLTFYKGDYGTVTEE